MVGNSAGMKLWLCSIPRTSLRNETMTMTVNQASLLSFAPPCNLEISIYHVNIFGCCRCTNSARDSSIHLLKGQACAKVIVSRGKQLRVKEAVVIAAAVGGGARLSALLQVAFDRLASPAVIDYFRREKLDVKLLKNLETLMLVINNLIHDAEDKETTDLAVKQWLHALKDAVYDAEDVLDVISTLNDTYKMETTLFNRLTSKLPSIIKKRKKLRFSWNPFDHPVDKELHDVLAKLQSLLEQKDVLGLICSRSETPMRSSTTFLVEKSGVYGRDVDKECIKNLLLSNDDGSNAHVIAIVGTGGLGKTMLAQLVFNDHEVNKVFKPNKIWIRVSKDFDVMKITKIILEKLTSQPCDAYNFDQLQLKLKETLSVKKFLLVLDDVCSENYAYWDNLQRPFSSCAPGSKVIVTTRSKRVAFVMRVTLTYELQPLSDEACWSLFSEHGFENIQLNACSTFKANVVKKCGGLPLAAKVLGGLLRGLGYEEWDDILRSNIWNLSDEVLPVLRLSYQKLPSNLKRCFAFCSIVPKDYSFRREKLVLLWMAENLLQDSRSKRRIDLGYQYLHDLESRSLIQSSTEGELYFSMQGLVSDLAKSVSGEFYKSFDHENLGEKTHHFSCVVTRDDHENPLRFKGVSEAKRLRTFLPLFCRWNHDVMLPSRLRSEIWLQLNVLIRSLTLARAGIKKLPNSIENLKLLCYLDLSENPELNQLPESLASLYNLKVLNLEHCGSLTKLPSKMKQLTKLNYLNTRCTRLQEIPLQIGRLKDLYVLTDFVVGKGSGSSIAELKELKDLRHCLSIHGLQNITQLDDAIVANLNGKSCLEELDFLWNIDHDKSADARILLENFRPHVNLKKLYIENYSGTRLPDWLGHSSFVALVSIELYHFIHCSDLSPLGHLPSLKSLTIYSCDSLVTLVHEIHDHVGHFLALVKLHISHCPKLELPQQHHCWTSIEDFSIWSSCDRLQSFAVSLFPKLTRLHLDDLQSIESLAVIDEANNINLDYLHISRCPNFQYFNDGKWCAPNMTDLKLKKCESLKALPENMCNLFPSLLKLELIHCPNLEGLPQSGLTCNLTCLTIWGCKKLESRCQREQGEDWSKIAHIPNIRVYSY